ncbi:MAG: polymer-forming cytoskeletal protein [Candidatus Zixiibacteriota bacterium]
MKIKNIKTEEIKMDGKMNTIIGKDSTITGTIEVKGPLRIDGKISGKVNCEDTVTIGSGGNIEAEINCRNASIAGKLKGNVIAKEKVELQAQSEINGDIKTKSLVIEQGAVFCGSCNMKDGRPLTTNNYSEAAAKLRKDTSETVK